MTPVFSIVIATYNRLKTLPKAVESVMAQTFTDWELIVVDDGSTDSTKAYMASLTDTRIRYIALPENQGASSARNRGIDEARGQYVMVWDSDDELYPDALVKLLTIFEKHSDVGIVSAPAVPLKGGKEELYAVREEGIVSLPQILVKYLPNNEKVRAARRELYSEARYRARNLDFMVNAYLARQAPWYHLKDPLGVLHIDNPDSLTRARKKRLKERAMERAEYLARYIEDFGDTLKKVEPKRLAAHAYGAAVGFYLAGNKEQALRFSMLSVGNAPGNLRYEFFRFILHTPVLHGVMRRLY